MQITKRRLKEIIKEELKTFTLNEELSTKGQQVLSDIVATGFMDLDEEERMNILRMIQAGQSTAN
tara:strand:- start:399 stop:593 length:195 start_codon:yes stop_codon:yes gene_type:complete